MKRHDEASRFIEEYYRNREECSKNDTYSPHLTPSDLAYEIEKKTGFKVSTMRYLNERLMIYRWYGKFRRVESLMPNSVVKYFFIRDLLKVMPKYVFKLIKARKGKKVIFDCGWCGKGSISNFCNQDCEGKRKAYETHQKDFNTLAEYHYYNKKFKDKVQSTKKPRSYTRTKKVDTTPIEVSSITYSPESEEDSNLRMNKLVELLVMPGGVSTEKGDPRHDLEVRR